MTNTFVADYNPQQYRGAANPYHRTHEWRLARLLEIADNPESSEQKELIDKMLSREYDMVANKINNMPRELADTAASRFKEYRELLSTASIEETNLIQTEFYNTVLEGAEPNKIMREAMQGINMGSNKMNVTLGESGDVLPPASEGGELKDRNQAYTQLTLEAEKYGEKNPISNELIEDSMYDIVAMEASKAGARAENTINHVALTKLIEDAGLEHDCENSNLGFDALAAARKEMKKNFYVPDTAIICADAEYELITDSQFSYASYYGGGTTPAVRTGSVPNVLGVEFYQYDPADSRYGSDDYTWGYSSDGDIGMVMFSNSDMAAVLGMRRDITVQNYNDPIRDLKGASISLRFAVDTPKDNAICRIEY